MLAIPNISNDSITALNASRASTGRNKLKLHNLSVSFGYDSPLKDVAKICAYCGREMLTEVEVNKLVNKLLSGKGKYLQEDLQKTIAKLEYSQNNSFHQHVLRNILELSKNYPNEDGKYLAQRYIKQKNTEFEKSIADTTEEKDEVFRQLRLWKPELPEYTQGLIDDLIKLEPMLLLTRYRGVDLLRRKSIAAGCTLPPQFIEYCDKISQEIPGLKEKTYLNTIKNYSSVELYTQLINPLKITMEHIHPHSKKDTNSNIPVDDTFNYLPVCSECNAERSNIDFVEQLEAKPGIVEFIVKSLQQVKRAVASIPNPVPELRDYIERVRQTLKRESMGKVDILV